MFGLHINKGMLFQRNSANRFTFLVIHKVGIDLCRGDILVYEHLADSINVCARGNLQRSVSMPEAMD